MKRTRSSATSAWAFTPPTWWPKRSTIDTLSYRHDAAPALWTCDGSSTYTLEAGTRASRGTEITLFIDKENEEFLDEVRLRQILQHYCAFLPFPIHLNGVADQQKAAPLAQKRF